MFWSDQSPLLPLYHLTRITREEKVCTNLINLFYQTINALTNFKNHISESVNTLDQNDIRGNQLGWEYIKFEIRQFSITFSKNLSKCVNADRELLEKKSRIWKNLVHFTLIMKTVKLVRQNLIISMIRKLRDLELETGVIGLKKEKNLLSSS